METVTEKTPVVKSVAFTDTEVNILVGLIRSSRWNADEWEQHIGTLLGKLQSALKQHAD